MRHLSFLAVLVGLLWPSVILAQPADLPAATSGRDAYAPFEPLIGRTYRGTGIGPNAVEDIQHWEWAIGGHAVRVTHSVNGGAYAGETLIFRDKDSDGYIFHYFTTGGFHTTGTMRPVVGGGFEIDETVHGVEGLERIRSVMTTVDGVRQARASIERDGQWVQTGGFDYREDPAATVLMPPLPARALEDRAGIGGLVLSRRIVRGVDTAGESVAGYLTVANGGAADALIGVSCTCAERVELHRIHREGGEVDMVTDPTWSVPGAGALEVRPGSDLHLMLIGYDPARAVDGKVTVTLRFRDAGEVTADFGLVEDTRAAWAAVD
jgi:copper(I)-binding protein